jgi:hypothetical protein
MRYVKMLGLAVVAAAALAVFFGASSASASTICAKNSTPCKTTAEGMHLTGTEIKASVKTGTKAILKAGIFTVECGEGTAEIITTNTGTAAENLKGNLSELTFAACGKANVTVESPLTAKKTTAAGTLSHTAGTMDGKLTVGAGVKVKIELLGETCFYGGPVNEKLTVIGGEPATMKAEKAKIERLAGSGPFCANPATWEAEYSVTSPTALFVAEG